MTEKVTPTIARDVTDWYPAEVKPVRVGLYEVKRPCMSGTPFEKCLMYWNGKQWRYEDRGYSDFGQPWEGGSRWRGLRRPA